MLFERFCNNEQIVYVFFLKHMLSLRKTYGTETSTGEHKKDVNVFGSDTARHLFD